MPHAVSVSRRTFRPVSAVAGCSGRARVRSQRFRVVVPAPLEAHVDDLAERRRAVFEQQRGAGHLRRLRQVVDVHRGPADGDAMSREGLAERVDVQPRRVVDAGGLGDGLASRAIWPRTESRVEPGTRSNRHARGLARRDGRDAAVQGESAARRRQADGRAAARLLAGGDGEQRPRSRCIAARPSACRSRTRSRPTTTPGPSQARRTRCRRQSAGRSRAGSRARPIASPTHRTRPSVPGASG